MRRISVNGIVFGLPFEHLLRPLSAGELAALRASVAAKGVLSPVVTATTPTWGRVIVDGMHRATVAEPLDVNVPLNSLGVLSDDEARGYALTLNLDRRHLSPEEMQAERQKRIARVGDMRRQGDSLRAIAQAEKISVAMVRRDIEDSPTAVVPPKHVLGVDGSVHRSTPPRRATRSSPAVRAVRAAAALHLAVRCIIRSPQRVRLEAVAAGAGHPFEGTDWPLLQAVQAILRDTNSGAAGG